MSTHDTTGDPHHAQVRDLLDDLRSAGRHEAHGEFQLDPDKARQKLQNFQLEDPHFYVLEFVQAAHLLGATRIDFTLRTGELEITFDGQPAPLERLDNIHAAVFLKRTDDATRALRHIGIGIVASHALSPSRIVVETGDENGGFAQTWRPSRDGEDGGARDETFRPERPGTRIFVKESWRAGHVLTFLRHMSGVPVEEVILRQRCKHARVPIFVNDTPITDQMTLTAPEGDPFLYERAFETDQERGVFALRRRGRSSEITILQNGVEVSTHHMPTSLITMHALLDSRRLNKNLSQSAFVEDAAWHALFRTVLRAELHRGLLELVEHELDLPDHKQDQPWLEGIARAVFDEVGRYRAQHIPEARTLDAIAEHARHRSADSPLPLFDETLELAAALETLPLWFIADRPPTQAQQHERHLRVSLRTLRAELGEEASALATSKEEHHTVAIHNVPRVLWHAEKTPYQHAVVILSRYLGLPLEDRTVALRNAHIFEKNYTRWQSRTWGGFQRVSERKLMGQVEVELPVAGGGGPDGTERIRVHLRLHRAQSVLAKPSATGLFKEKTFRGSVLFIKEGRLLRSVNNAPLPLPGLDIAIDGALEPNDLFDDVVRDTRLIHQVVPAIFALHRLLTDYTERLQRKGKGPNADDVGLLTRWVDLTASWYLVDTIAEALALNVDETRAVFERYRADIKRPRTSWDVPPLHQPRQQGMFVSRRLLAGTVRPPSLGERLDAFGELRYLPLVHGHDLDGGLSLHTLLDEQREQGNLAIIPSETRLSRKDWVDAEVTRTVLTPTPVQKRLLDLFFLARYQLDYADTIRTRAAKTRFLRKPQEPLTLTPAPHGALHTHTISDLPGGGGELVLLPCTPRHPGALHARVLYQSRMLTEIEVDLRVGRFLAVVQSTLVTPNATWDDLARGDRTNQLRQTLRDAATTVLRQWCEATLRAMREGDEEDAEARDAARVDDEMTTLWSLLARLRADRKPMSRALDALSRTLHSGKMFPATNGKQYSLQQLLTVLRPGHKLHYVVGENEPLADMIPTAKTLVIRIPSSFPPQSLGAVFPDVSFADVSMTQQRANALREAQRRFLARAVRPARVTANDTLAKMPLASEGIHGELALLPAPDRREGEVELNVLFQRRLMFTTTVTVPFGRFIATIDSEHLRPTPEWDNVVRGDEVDDVIQLAKRHCAALMASFVEEQLGRILHDLASAEEARTTLHILARTGALDTQDRRALITRPLFPMIHGEPGSWAKLRWSAQSEKRLLYTTQDGPSPDLLVDTPTTSCVLLPACVPPALLAEVWSDCTLCSVAEALEHEALQRKLRAEQEATLRRLESERLAELDALQSAHEDEARRTEEARERWDERERQLTDFAEARRAEHDAMSPAERQLFLDTEAQLQREYRALRQRHKDRRTTTLTALNDLTTRIEHLLHQSPNDADQHLRELRTQREQLTLLHERMSAEEHTDADRFVRRALDRLQHPGAQLLDNLREELLAIRGYHQELLLDGVLEDLILEDRGAPVTVTADVVAIAPDHPAWRHFTRTPDDPFALAILASTVYSAINAFYEEITDDHEGQFQQQLVQRLLTVSP